MARGSFVLCKCLVLLFVACVYGKDSSHGKRDSLYTPYASYTELTSSVTGTLTPTNNTAYFVIHLAAGQIANFTSYYEEEYLSNLRAFFTLVGSYVSSTDVVNNYLDYPITRAPYNITLAEHCPSQPATYFFYLQANSPVNYTLVLKKVPVRALSIGYQTGNLIAVKNGQLAIPVTTQCIPLIIDVILSQTQDMFLEYECRDRGAVCGTVGEAGTQVEASVGGVPVYDAATASYLDKNQFYVNCASIGTYYLKFQVGAAGIDYKINITQSAYPCPSWCRNRGVCDLTTLQCKCTAGFSGPNCTVPVNTIDTTNATIVDIPIGVATNYSYPNVSQNNIYPVRIVVPAHSASSVIQLVYTILPTIMSDLVIFYNADTPASNSNYHSYDSVSASYDDPVTVERFLPLCTGVTAWYVAIYAQYVIPKTITFTASIVDISAPGNSFVGGFYPSLANTDYKIRPYYFQATSAGTAMVRVDEMPATPVLVGVSAVSVASSCSVKNTLLTTTATTHPVHYQVTQAVTANQGFYVYIAGVSAANFTVSVNYVSAVSCPGCVLANGFCSATNTCVCTYGWKGSNCDQVDAGSNVITVTSGNPVNFNIPAGLWSQGNLQVLRFDLAAGFNMYVTATSKLNTIQTYTGVNDLPDPYIDTSDYSLYLSSTVTNALTQCLPAAPTQYYMLLATEDQQAGTATINATMYDGRMLSNGSPKAFTLPVDHMFAVRSTPTTCSRAYKVTVKPTFNQWFQAYIGETNEGCSTNNDVNINSADPVIIVVNNCSNTIDIRYLAYGAGNLVETMTITITPTTACPGNCGGHGQCLDGGVCSCIYPYVGDDCSSYDRAGSNIAATFATCNGTNAIAYKPGTGSYLDNDPSPDHQWCAMIQADKVTVPGTIQSAVAKITGNGINLTPTCRTELQQIFCDYTFLKMQPAPTGGNKIMLPCNCRNFTTRCIPGFYLNDLELPCQDIENRIKQDSVYMCNPNPGVIGTTGIAVTSTGGTVTGSTGNAGSTTKGSTSQGQGSSTSTPGASTSTTGADNNNTGGKKSKNNHVGLIVGTVVGGTVLIAAAVFLFIKRDFVRARLFNRRQAPNKA